MKTHPIVSTDRGFALIVTLSLMILLTIVAVGLLTLSSISLRASSQGEAMATARSNAKLALMMAIGDLQVTLGPDKAISATSSILSPNPGKPNTAGAWESWDFDPNSSSLAYNDEKKTRFSRWLVSAPKPEDAENMDFGTSGWTGKTIELVGDKALGGPADAAEKATAGLIPLSRNNKAQGSYAWHVSDESVKARINLYRDPGQNGTLAQKRALLAGHRPDVSLVKGAAGANLSFLPTDYTAPDFEKATKDSDKVLDLNQVKLLDNASKISSFRNLVTPYSRGVLSNVRTGGLKKDLSSTFEMTGSATSPVLPAEFKDKKLYQSTHGITGISDPNWSALSAYYNTFRSVTNIDSNPTFYQRPAQSVLMTNEAPPTGFYPGPVIAKVETLFSFVARDSHGPWVASLKAVDPKMVYMGHLVYTPVVTLHNPYNINLSFDNLEVIIRNVPIAFKFYINRVPQSRSLVSLTEMFVDGKNRAEKSFALRIGNWSSPTASSTATTGQIVMKPGQTLVCGPYLDPGASFSNAMGTPFFDYRNDLTGYKDLNGTVTVNPIKAKPGFAGRCVGFDIDWLTPNHGGLSSGQQSDNEMGVMGLRPTDTFAVEYAIKQPTLGLRDSFEVSAKLTSQGRTYEYGGLSFQYKDAATLQKYFDKTFRYPSSGEMASTAAYVPNTDPISGHARAQTVGVFSAYARTTSGGVYETNKRTPTNGAVNSLRDGRLAGKPFLFHNPARTVVKMDLKASKPGSHSHELNFQQFRALGEVEDYFIQDATNRTPYLTGNTTKRGIKSGSYLELPTGPMQTIADFRRSNALASSYLPNFVQPVGNSFVSPLMSTDKVIETDTTVAAYALMDHSVLANHALYDRFYFSTFATKAKSTPADQFENFMAGKEPLLSQAFEPYLPSGKTPDAAKNELFASGKPKDTAYQLAAEYQMIRGPFNVNSTNVQAWKAVLSSMNKNDIYSLVVKVGKDGLLVTELLKTTPAGAPILAMSLLNGENAKGGNPTETTTLDQIKTNEWNGYRELTDSDLEKLAEEIVAQVRSRGPFLSMSEFVNRQIGANSEFSLKGALEAAIEKSGINDAVFASQIPIMETDVTDALLYNYKTPVASTGNPAAGAPGWISQGDLLRILEPAATVRSDTFVVRVCGEAWDAAGKVTARAFAEAVVQRIPDYVDPANRPSLNVYTDGAASAANKMFGRRMSVVSFRWLSSNEV